MRIRAHRRWPGPVAERDPSSAQRCGQIAESGRVDEDATDSRKAARSPGYAPPVMWGRWTC